MKKLISCATALLMTLSSLTLTHAADDKAIKVFIDGTQLSFDVNPTIENDRTLVPMRAIFEALGATVTWDGKTQTAYAVKGNDVISITIDNYTLTKNDVPVELDVPARIIGDRTLVPVRAVSESFDAEVVWDGENSVVNITNRKQEIDLTNVTYYADFDYIPDFGAYSGVSNESRDITDVYYYLNTTGQNRQGYLDLLVSLGFNKSDELVNDDIESYAYQKENEIIVMAYYNSEELFALSVMKERTGYKGELQFYENYPAVPDYGALNACEAALITEPASNITGYIYELDNSSTEGSQDATDYTRALSECGFELMYQLPGSLMYTNQESQNTVILTMQDGMLEILIEQWPEETQAE